MRYHFIGIGGAGMSGIAHLLLAGGEEVTGTDLKSGRNTDVLVAAGARINVPHDPAMVEGADIVVVSSAIPAAEPELVRAQELGLAIIERGAMIPRLAAGKRTIAVAGTHGKTTTTSLAVSAFVGAGADPTYLVGGELNDSGTNAGTGRGRHFICELDESDGSFLEVKPDVAVVTNVDADHLDFYGSEARVHEYFHRFLAAVPEDGKIVACAEDAGLRAVVEGIGRHVLSYGFQAACDYRAEIISEGEVNRVRISYPGGGVEIGLAVPGAHNALNAAGAFGAAHCEGLDAEAIATGLTGFRGVKRRFERLGQYSGAEIVDDYAHHPSEVMATLAAARTVADGEIVAVFQPHRYTRTLRLADQFGAAFGAADSVLVTDIYGAGEEPIPGVTGELIHRAVLSRGKKTRYIPHRRSLLEYVADRAQAGQLILFMGAGDIRLAGEELAAWGRQGGGPRG